MSSKYHLEFILHIQNTPEETIKNSLIEFGEDLRISSVPKDDINKGKNFKINICTQDPTIIFDTCSQFGRLKSVKINEEGGR